jgi:hypothetical protein
MSTFVDSLRLGGDGVGRGGSGATVLVEGKFGSSIPSSSTIIGSGSFTGGAEKRVVRGESLGVRNQSSSSTFVASLT